MNVRVPDIQTLFATERIPTYLFDKFRAAEKISPRSILVACQISERDEAGQTTTAPSLVSVTWGRDCEFFAEL